MITQGQIVNRMVLIKPALTTTPRKLTPVWRSNSVKTMHANNIRVVRCACTVFHAKRIDFEIFKLLGHNFLRKRYQVTKFDLYILPHIHYVSLQFCLITPNDCDFMASSIGNVRKIL